MFQRVLPSCFWSWSFMRSVRVLGPLPVRVLGPLPVRALERVLSSEYLAAPSYIVLERLRGFRGTSSCQMKAVNQIQIPNTLRGCARSKSGHTMLSSVVRRSTPKGVGGQKIWQSSLKCCEAY